MFSSYFMHLSHSQLYKKAPGLMYLIHVLGYLYIFEKHIALLSKYFNSL